MGSRSSVCWAVSASPTASQLGMVQSIYLVPVDRVVKSNAVEVKAVLEEGVAIEIRCVSADELASWTWN
jgi:hypothetical protein